MTTWDRYMLRIGTFAFLVGVGIFSGFLIVGELLRRFLELVMEHGVPIHEALKFFVLRLPNIVTMSLPMAVLLASVIVIGQLSHDNEILALFSSGISFARLSLSLLVIGALASVIAFGMRNYLVPQSDRVAERLLSRISGKPIAKSVILRHPPYGELRQLIFVERFEPEKGIMHGVQIVLYGNGEPMAFISAREAVWRNGGWILKDGFWQVISTERVALAQKFDEMHPSDWSSLPEPPLRKSLSDARIEALQLEPDKMTISELRSKLRHMRRHGADKFSQMHYATELHNRFVFAWACFLMALLGAPLGLRTRQAGLGLALGLSIIIVLAYYFAWYYGTILARQGRIPIVVGCWLPNLLSLVIGMVLLVRSTRA